MRSLASLADHALRQGLLAACARDRAATVDLLAHIAEFEARRLYLPAGYPSMHLYCVHELRMSEDSAFKRWQAARAAREFPAIFGALSDGRLHLSAVVMLAPHLTRDNATALLEEATHKSKAEISLLLAERLPRAEVPASVRVVAAPAVADRQPVMALAENAVSPAPGQVDLQGPRSQSVLAPLAPTRYELRATLDQEAHDLLVYAKSLLSHAIPSGDLALVLKRALTQLVEREEKRVFAACCRTRPKRGAPQGRYVPADVRREVWLRDGGRCAFTSASGTRCPSRTRIQFDHVTPVSRGGESTTANLRLCCRAHNQYEAERVLGAAFMEGKREQRRRMRAERQVAAASPIARSSVAEPHTSESSASPAPGQVDIDARRAELIPWLRKLGLRVDEAKRGAAFCDALADAPLEQRVKFALSGLARERYRLPARHAGATASSSSP